MLRAVVLAAGASRRMGRPKSGLPIYPGGPTFAAALVGTLQAAGLGEVTIVAGAHPDAVRDAVSGLAAVRVIEHAGWMGGQLTSLVAGLDAIAGGDVEGLLVALVDSPLVRVDTVAQLVAEWRTTRAPIVRPAQGERHGHPVIFDRATFDALRRAPREIGAKAVIAAFADGIRNVPIDDPGIFADIDTPEDLSLLHRVHGARSRSRVRPRAIPPGD
jgi:molybdenum cofactor cytidylyltransferase